jgi:hypothetical protein
MAEDRSMATASAAEGFGAFDETGWLPEGLYHSTLDEIEQRLGQFVRNDKRPTLMRKLRAYIDELRKWPIAMEVLVDGSFVSATHDPGDIDVILVLRADFVSREEDWRPTETNLVSKSYVQRNFEIDLWTAVGDPRELAVRRGFMKKKPPLVGGKGLLRVTL